MEARHRQMTVLVEIASFATYLIYHYLEPEDPKAHFALLIITPASLAIFPAPTAGLLTFALTFLQYWTSIIVFTILYRLSPFHPLASYPGPFAARISKFWAAYNTFTRGDMHRTLRALHEKYGEVVRVGPNELSFATADAIQPILSAKIFPKGPYYNVRRQGHLLPLDGQRDFVQHAARRKPWVRALNTDAIKEFEGDIREKVKQLVKELEARSKRGDTIDISMFMSCFAFDFMGSVIFAQDFGMIKAGGDVHGFWHLLEEGVSIAGALGHVPWMIPILTLIPGSDEGMKKLIKFGQGLAQARVKAGSQRKDLIYYLMSEDDPTRKEKATLNSITADAMMAVIAGSDTTASALSQLWYFLLKNPQCYARLRKEVLAENDGDYNRQANMPYLNACINEALRLYPPVIGSLQRWLEPGTGGQVVANHYVPEGTQLSVHLFTLHRSSEHFSPIPDTFWPDRWLSDQSIYTLPTGESIPASKVETDRSVFLPFSAGPQNCVGKAMANVEMRAVTEAIVRRFERLDVAEDRKSIETVEHWEQGLKDLYVQVRPALMVKLIPA
ncbi:cytochrome P450 [Irpex lacteus]|nr:cytochrome P450 [Irpex lacteus]